MDIDSLGLLLSFVIASTVIELTPGVNMSYLAILSVTDGKKAGFFAVAGVALGLLIIGLASSLGVAALISNSPVVYEVLRFSGFLYLLYLAYDTWKTKVFLSEKEINSLIYHARFFRRGLINNLLNPKAVIFYIAILPKFIDTTKSVELQAVTLTIIYVLIATIIHVLVVLLASSTRKLLRDEKTYLRIRKAMSALLVIVAIWFFFETSRDLF